MHAGHSHTNLHWRPHVAHKTFSRQIQTACQHTVRVPLQNRRTISVLYLYKQVVLYQRTALLSKNWGVPYRAAILAYAEACSEFAEPISASLQVATGHTTYFEKCRTWGKPLLTLPDLTSSESHSKSERIYRSSKWPVWVNADRANLFTDDRSMLYEFLS